MNTLEGQYTNTYLDKYADNTIDRRKAETSHRTLGVYKGSQADRERKKKCKEQNHLPTTTWLLTNLQN